jgi:hypothetical protein
MLKGEGELQNIEQGISNDEVVGPGCFSIAVLILGHLKFSMLNDQCSREERGEPQRQEAQRGTGSFIQWIKKKKLRG